MALSTLVVVETNSPKEGPGRDSSARSRKTVACCCPAEESHARKTQLETTVPVQSLQDSIGDSEDVVCLCSRTTLFWLTMAGEER